MMSATTTKSFDWADALARLAKAAQSLQEDRHLSPEQVRTIHEERAKVLARVPPRDADDSASLELLIFQWGSERIAVETKIVREVSRLGQVTPLPGAPNFFVGLTNLRGEMLAVLDLRSTFGFPAAGDASVSSPPMIVLGGSRPELGLLADEVIGVERIHDSELTAAPAYLSELGHDLLRGVTKDALLILNGHVVLTDPRLYVDEG